MMFVELMSRYKTFTREENQNSDPFVDLPFFFFSCIMIRNTGAGRTSGAPQAQQSWSANTSVASFVVLLCARCHLRYCCERNTLWAPVFFSFWMPVASFGTTLTSQYDLGNCHSRTQHVAFEVRLMWWSKSFLQIHLIKMYFCDRWNENVIYQRWFIKG